MVHFSAFTKESTAWQVESTALMLQSHCVIKQEVSKYVPCKELSDLNCQQGYFLLPIMISSSLYI